MEDEITRLNIRPELRRRVRQRLAVLRLAEKWGRRAAAERMGVCDRTIRRWQDRYRDGGVAALVPQYSVHRPQRTQDKAADFVVPVRRS